MPALEVGKIYRHAEFYRDSATQQYKPKYLVALAYTPGGDIVARLLTSRATGRPTHPPCFHGAPYPGYFLGVLGKPLTANSWVDLRGFDDLDSSDARNLLLRGTLSHVGVVPANQLRPLLDCVARAPDTRAAQERAIRDQLGQLQEAATGIDYQIDSNL